MARRIVSACNELYAEAATTLVASVHRTAFDLVDEIVVYDLGISSPRRAELERMEKVVVRDFPSAAYQVYRGYMVPGNFGWKLWILDEARLYAHLGDSVLWLDAGVTLVRSIEPLLALLERDEVFCIGHDDVDEDLSQQSWTTARALELMEASDDERAAPQIHGGVFGWKVGGRYQHVVDQAFAWSLEPEILLGPRTSHRADQSILSTLCVREGVPRNPQAIFGEWRGPDVHAEQVVYVHRRAYVDHAGLRWRAPRVVMLTSDASSHLLPAFAHLFAKYWNPGPEIVVGGFSEPEQNLPPNLVFRRLGAFADYPIERWSDALIELLDGLIDELVVWCMDDYWLTERVDVDTVARLAEYMRAHPDVARCDLTSDVVHVGHVQELGGELELVECVPGAPYRLGLQCGIWRRELLLRYLARGETPWQSEHAGTARMEAEGARVIGSRRAPVRYLIAMQQGRLTLDGGWQEPKVLLSDADLAELEALGHLPAAVR